jgi:hypothetical protein
LLDSDTSGSFGEGKEFDEVRVGEGIVANVVSWRRQCGEIEVFVQNDVPGAYA